MTNCLICGAKNKFTNKIKVEKYFYNICGECFGGTLMPRENAVKELSKVYKPSYFNWEKVTGLKNFLYNVRLHDSYPDWIEKYHKKGKILDVGAGIPDFVKSMKNRGWKVQAQELSLSQAKKLKVLLGKNNVIAGDFEKVKLVNYYYDVVTFWHVLEHVKFPQKTILKTKKILKKGGYIFMEVPNISSFTWKLFGNNYSLLSVPAHLFYYSEKSLKMLLSRYGFKVLEITYPTKYSSAFVWSLLNGVKTNFGLNNKEIENIIFFLLLPFSLILNLILNTLGKSEVVRVVAQKSI